MLVAGYGLNEAVALQIRKLTHSEIAFLVAAPGQPERLAVSSLGPREAALAAALSRPELAGPRRTPFEVDLGGDRHIGVRIPLKAAGGEEIGAGARAAQPGRGDRLLPPVPQQPRRSCRSA